ncbi:MAG: T9SS type A sorting domain-containing protein [Ignavibacteriales bacterium]|nr:T9SS type A sorting domain-containing protein [Ignavibacteriales bacterium]
MKRIPFILAAILIVSALPISMVQAQTPDSTVWLLNTTVWGMPTNTANLAADSATLGPAANWILASYNTNGRRCNLGAAGWPASETDTAADRYEQFETAPKAGKSFTVTYINLNYGGAGSTNAMKSNLYYSVDGWKTRKLANTDSSLLHPNSTMATYYKALNVVVAAGAKFSLRIYPYWVSATAGSNSKYLVLNDVAIGGTTKSSTDVRPEQSGVPGHFEVYQNYPNPFNPATMISYSLPGDQFVTVKVFNLVGQEVAAVYSGRVSAGYHQVQFDASHLASGIYLYRVQAGSSVDMKRMTLVK